jgi:DNA-binding CsgD family transcriptional regulator
MEHLARELARLAWQLERDAEDLLDQATQPNRSVESTDAIAHRLIRIEGKVSDIHGHTSELIRRVPGDLGPVLAELKQVLITSLESLSEANHSHGSVDSRRVVATDQATHSAQSAGAAAPSLTPQERKVFQMCFRSGFLSYQDIASQLDITATAAKNLVNRIFQSDRKRSLFTKQYQHGAVRVGLQPAVQGRILVGRVS